MSLAVGSLSTSAQLVAQQSVPGSKDAATRSKAAAAPLAFEGVTVVDVRDGHLLHEQTVVVTGNRVRAIGQAGKVRVPKGAQVVDARGKYLIPGLWDMSAHIDSRLDEFYPLFIAHGVTGLREMAQRSPNAADSFRVWQRKIAAGSQVGPRVVGPSADLSADGIQIATPGDARRVMDSLKTAGIVFVKYRNSSSDRDLFFAVAREARRVGIPLVGYIPKKVMDVEASDSGLRNVEHIEENHQCWPDWPAPLDSAAAETQCAPVAKSYVHNGTWMTVMLSRVHWAEKNFPAAQQFVRMMHRLGVTKFLVGTDWGTQSMNREPRFRPGSSTVEEVMFLAGAGLTPLEALQAGTLNPATFFNATDSLGTVTQGKLADLVLLDADPLADIHNILKIQAVVANGRYFDRATLDTLDPDGIKVARIYMDELVMYGRLRRHGVLGINSGNATNGVQIQSIAPNSAAQAAGLAVGDIIVAVDGKPVGAVTQLQEQARAWKAEQTIKIEVIPRAGGAHRMVSATLGER